MRLYTFVFLILLGGVISSNTCNKSNLKHSALSNSDTVLFHHRSYCYGRCPVYKILLTGDGKLHYEAIANNADTGHFESTDNLDNWQSFISEAKSLGYFNLKERYDNSGIQDLPMKTTAMRGEHGLKWVYDRYQGPAMMDKLYDRIDTLIAHTHWNLIEN